MNILLTSVGRRSYVVQYFKDALDGVGKVFAGNCDETYALYKADAYVITPLIYDNKYIEFLLKYCKDNNIEVIIPLFDIDLLILSQNKKKFEEFGISVIVSDEECIQICNDKWLTYNFLIKNQLKTPKTFLTINNTLQAIETKSICFPLVIKPRWGMGSIGLFDVDNSDELRILYNKVLNTIKNSYLKYESLQSIENCIIIQEKLIGVEYGLDILNDLRKEFLTCIPKRKLAMRAGETDCAEIIENNQLFKLGKNLSSSLKHIGNLDVDCKIGRAHV